MKITKSRWSNVYESSEEELTDFLEVMGINTVRWTASEDEEIPEKTLSTERRIWCAEGSLIFKHGTVSVSVQPGDAIVIPAGLSHSALVGISGCACYEEQ